MCFFLGLKEIGSIFIKNGAYLDVCYLAWITLYFQDQKILELMMQKREEERKQEAKRDAARRAWETEKQKDAAQKTTTEIKRRESIGRIRLSSYKVSPRPSVRVFFKNS